MTLHCVCLLNAKLQYVKITQYVILKECVNKSSICHNDTFIVESKLTPIINFNCWTKGFKYF